jgi:hypothetical protein
VNIFGKIGYPNRMDFWKQNSLLVEVDDLSVATGSDPTGRVLASHLVISGLSIDATLHITAETGGGQFYTLNTDTGDVYSKFLPDTPIGNLQHPYTRLKVKLVSWTTLWRAEPHTQSLLFMVIEPARDRNIPDEKINRKTAFERLGMVQINWDDAALRETEDFDARLPRTSFKWYEGSGTK